MELERIALGALGLLSVVALIVWLRWEGIPEDQKKDEPPQYRREENAKQRMVDQSSLIT